jgi:hypothetical protein
VGNTIGVEYLNGVTTTALSINTAGHTLVVSVENMAVFVPTVKGGPVSIGVAEVAATVGSVLGTPGELLVCVIPLSDCRLRYIPGPQPLALVLLG